MPAEEKVPFPVKKVYPVRDIPLADHIEPTTGGWLAGLPIAIDLGTDQTKVGYANETSPSHVFSSLSVKHRDRRINRTYLLCGNDVFVDQSARLQARSPFDGPLISNWEIAENLLDYCFAKLSVQSQNGVDNPILLSEIPGVTNSQRKSMNELLFEGYRAPKVAYGIDSLFSFYYNRPNASNGLVISSGNEASHIIPVVNGKGILSLSKRINWGGRQSANYLQSLLSLKYPLFPTKLTQSQATFLARDHCYVSSNYLEEIDGFLDWKGLDQRERIVEVPFTPTVIQEKSQEELDALAERRKESGRRLQEQAAKKRLDKLIQRENDLEYYKTVKTQISSTTKKDGKRILEREGFRDENMLQKTMNELEKAIRHARKQDVGDDDSDDKALPSFPLVEIPDDQLDEEGIKEKRRQRLLKASYDARMRAKEEKLLEKERQEEQEKKDAEWRRTDLTGWIKDRRGKLNVLVEGIRERKRLKEELSNRKSMATQQRMKNITALASDSAGRKRRRGKDEDVEDSFGANDDDWAVYRNIANVSDEEEGEEEQKTVSELQEQLLLHDPNFSMEEMRDEQGDWRDSVLHMFLRGPHEFDGESQAQQHQLALNVERIRVPEVLFEPSIAGVDQAGIGELSSDILRHRLDPSIIHSVASNIFITGGQAYFENFDERVRRELRSILDVDTPLKVYRAKDPILDAWKGMAQWATSNEFNENAVTRQEYEEMGSDYIKENRFGNAFL